MGARNGVPPYEVDDIVRHPQKWGSGVANHKTVALEDRISALTTKDSNKLKVYEDGYDGHSLRAHAYFGDHMPDIEVAPEGARCFKAMAGGKTIFFHEQEQVTYLGQEMTGLELWERLQNVKVAAE